MFSFICAWDKLFSKQSTRRWFKKQSYSLWRHYNEMNYDTIHVKQLDSVSFKTACGVCIILHDHVAIKGNRKLNMAFKFHGYNHTYRGGALHHHVTEEWSLTTWPLAPSLNTMIADELASLWISSHKINLVFQYIPISAPKRFNKNDCSCSKILHIPWTCDSCVCKGPHVYIRIWPILSMVLSCETVSGTASGQHWKLKLFERSLLVWYEVLTLIFCYSY